MNQMLLGRQDLTHGGAMTLDVRIGKLSFGYPSQEAVQKLYSEMDFQLRFHGPASSDFEKIG